MIKKLFLASLLSFIMVACGENCCSQPFGSFEVVSPRSCSLEDKNQFVYDVLKDSYLWSDKVGDLNISLETDETQFLDNFLYKEDRFSFILTVRDYNDSFVAGKSTDFGYLSALVKNDQDTYETKIAYVYKNSPADLAGIRRSDSIISSSEINGTNLYQLRIKHSDGLIRDIELEEKPYAVVNTSHQTIFEVAGKKVGYFVFKSFVGPHLVENLDNTFAYFKENKVDDLILDLRYNGGGLLDVAAHLGALIGGNNVKGHVFQNNRFNRKYSRLNSSTFFDTIPQESLNLKRIFIIATQNSASASESLINALKASENHIEVTTVGTNTYGKPFGMRTMPYCDKVLVPIHFASENSEGKGGFVDGLVPTCKAQENFNKDFADVHETLLDETLYYIKNGHCRL